VSAASKPEDAGARAYAALTGPLAELRERGQLRSELEVPAIADALWSALHGIIALKLTCPNFPATPTETLMPTVLRIFFAGCVTG
jgi:hypothetical protein